VGADQNSLRRCRISRIPRHQITKLDCASVRRLLSESLLAGLPAEARQTIDEVLANLLVRIAAGWPGTEISERLGFCQSLATVEIAPDFLAARRCSTRNRGIRLAWFCLFFLRACGCWRVARSATGGYEKQIEKPERSQCRTNIGPSFRRLPFSLSASSCASH